MNRRPLSIAAILLILAVAHVGRADDTSDGSSSAESGVANESQQRYLLRYKFAPHELLRWKVIHLGKMETTIQGNTQTPKSRSVSTKVWKIDDVDDAGNVTFTHSIESVEMWQQDPDRPELRRRALVRVDQGRSSRSRRASSSGATR